jgi:hypothetical protein
VSAPVDLVPAEMEDVRLESLKDGAFYALTFRKPGSKAACAEAAVERSLVAC